MGANEIVTSSKPDKSSSIMQEQPSVHPYPDWTPMQAFYGPGVPIPSPYFGTAVAPGHTPHPYLWNPQSMISPFGGPYAAIYPHGVYSHPPATHMVSPMNPDVVAKPSTSKERGIGKKKVLDGRAASVGNVDAESVDCNENGFSESENDPEGSSDGSDGNSESGGGSKRIRNRSSEDIPNSGDKNAVRPSNTVNGAAREIPPTISLGVTAAPATVTGTPLVPVPLASLTPAMDERELKREKRKQSNRESARRSRLRKQAETEELAIKVGTLTTENTTLRSEISRLTESSAKLRLENSFLMDKLKMANPMQEEEIASDGIDNEDAPSLVIENLLSRIDNSSPVCENKQMEDEPHENSNGKLHQLLDSNSRTDVVAAS
ncbi:hypothetical protein HPP92_025820 [Vanilla planifolia]|uniref:BZIP domain-containing protein n=1 Tax=Vanilla planifolia TaxID=51239 RepID=A0A835PEA3_VANPL|nr:hypothetical protein HPP92_025820 [Vanilla planifolia]